MERRTLLIAEDSPDVAEFLVWALEPLGLRIRVVGSGRDALDVAKTDKVDCVLSDIQMPFMDGLTLLASMRELGHLAPVILVTGTLDITVVVAALRLGAFDFLIKPPAIEKLRSAVTEAMGYSLKLNLLESKVQAMHAASGASPEELRLCLAARSEVGQFTRQRAAAVKVSLRDLLRTASG